MTQFDKTLNTKADILERAKTDFENFEELRGFL
jgi:hypothetical protein